MSDIGICGTLHNIKQNLVSSKETNVQSDISLNNNFFLSYFSNIKP